MEADFKSRREQSEGLIERLKEFTCNTLRGAGGPDFQTVGWETSLTRVLT